MTDPRRRRLRGAVTFFALAAFACLVVPGTATAAEFTHTFDSGDQDWAVGNNDPAQQGNFFAPTHNAAGGNPGGHISATDVVAEDCVAPAFNCSSLLFTFDEPSDFGWFGPNYGGTFSFDAKASAAGATEGLQVEIHGNGSILVKTFQPLTTNWATKSAVLDPAGGWFYCSDACESANSPWMWEDVLFSDPQIVIFVDGLPGIGETYSLDNVVLTKGPDGDGDGAADGADNCPTVFNPDQLDSDFDQEGGNACDVDDDNDGVADATDNCHLVQNQGQENGDGDPQGDACDADDDNDTVADANDNCRLAANTSQENNDADAEGDACDADDDNDTVADANDNCNFVANQGQGNNDADAAGDACDQDDDNDGVFDANDSCPNEAGVPGYNGCAGGGDGGGGGGGGAADTTAPDTTIPKAPKKKTTKRKVKVAFTSNEPGSTFTCELNGKPAVPCTSPFKAKSKKGRNKLLVTATDAAGNNDATPAMAQWKFTPRAARGAK